MLSPVAPAAPLTDPPAAPLSGPPVNAWPSVARDLAQRVTRRARLGAALSAATAPLGVAALLAVAARTLGPLPGAIAPATLAIGALVATLFGLRAVGRVRPTRVEDTALALDRVFAAKGAGVAAALARPAVARAAAARAPTPTSLPLEAPPGLASLCAVLLLALGALVLPQRTGKAPDPGAPRRPDETRAAGRTPGSSAALEAAADVEAADAKRRRVVREALGLPAEGPLHREDLVRALAQPKARDAARAVATPEAAAALAREGEAAVAGLGEALSADPSARAEALRRQALAQRAAAPGGPVPPGRRAFVARYLAARLVASPPAPTDPGASPEPPPMDR